MEKIMIADIVVFVIVYVICMIIGLDLKKWQSWLAGLYGFLSGCLIGFLIGAGSPSWQLGLIFAMMIMSSAVMRQYRIYYRKVGDEWLARYGQDRRYSLLARLIEKVLRK
jgi:hypothetical protein